MKSERLFRLLRGDAGGGGAGEFIRVHFRAKIGFFGAEERAGRGTGFRGFCTLQRGRAAGCEENRCRQKEKDAPKKSHAKSARKGNAIAIRFHNQVCLPI